jgi:hypothetical protein
VQLVEVVRAHAGAAAAVTAFVAHAEVGPVGSSQAWQG